MAGESDNTTLMKLDLDAASFIENGLKAKDTFSSIFNTESLQAAGEQLVEFGATAGVIAAAFYAAKAAVDLVFDAENIRMVNAQFEQLTQNAGVYADELKSGLQEASKGWVDDTELMKLANKAMVELQTGVDKLPEIMDLARKSVSVMGGDIKDRFDEITRAVATGNARGLRAVGIYIDQNKALSDYAKSIGATVDTLSKAGQQQAILNAALEYGKNKLAGQNEDIRHAQNSWAQFKVAIKEIGETFTLVFDSIMGPTVRRAIDLLADMAKSTKNVALGVFGDDAQKAEARISSLNDMIAIQNRSISEMKAKIASGKLSDTWVKYFTQDIEVAEQRIAKFKAEIADAKAKAKGGEEAGRGPAGGTPRADASKIDQEKMLEQETKFKKDMESIHHDIQNEEIQGMDSVAEATKLYNQQRLADVEKIESQIKQIQAAAATGKTITQKQADAEIAKLNQLKNLKMMQDDAALAKLQAQALDNYLAHSENVAQGIGRTFQVTAQKNKMAMQDFGAFGTKSVDSFSSHATSSLQAFGAGSKSAADAAASAFGGMVGDMATHYGEMLLLSSIWPPNPVGMAAGAALIALGGFLGSLGGGSAASSTAGVSQTAMMNTAAAENYTNPGGGTPLSGSENNSAPQKNVTLVVQGHMMMNDHTQKWLVDQIRAASDATGFTVQSVNGGF